MPADEREFAQAPEVPQVGLHGVRAVAGLEREKVAEPFQPEGLVDPFPNRRGGHRLLLRAEAPAELRYLGRPDAEQLGGQKHEPVLVRAAMAPDR